MDFLFDVEKVLESFVDCRIRGGEFEEDVSFLEICGSVVEFEIVDGEDVIGDKVVDKSEHFDRMGS